MSSGKSFERRRLDRRLIALERAPAARGVEIRAYSTDAEADADTRPPRPGATVLRIVTGVSRSPDASTP
jgi:hypothetical protein